MSAEPIRVLVAVVDPESLSTVEGALRATPAFVPTLVGSADEVARAAESDPHDVLRIALPLFQRLPDASPRRARGPGRPVILLADPEEEGAASEAVAYGCADYILRPDLSPALVRHALRYAIDSCRTERQRQRVEHALAQSEERYRSLFEQSRDAILMTGPT